MSQTAVALMNSFRSTHCAQQIQFVGSDNLIIDPPDPKVHERGIRWTKAIEKFPSDIIILTVGAHINNNTRWKEIIDTVLEEISERRKSSADTESLPKFVFKTQQPGGCSKDISLLNPAETAQVYDYSQYKSYTHRYFYNRDLYLLSKLRQHNVPSIDFRMLYSRTDAKISSRGDFRNGDCIHLCWPGPLDVIGLLFSKLLGELDGIH